MYVYGFIYTHMHVDFVTIPPLYLWVQVLHDGGRDGNLAYRYKYRRRGMVLGGHLSWYYWREWSINRGEMKRTTSFGNNLSLFILTSKNFSLSSILLPAKKRQQQHIFFPSILFTHSLSPLIPSQTFPYFLYTKKASFTYFTSSKDHIEHDKVVI